ncbi:nuclear transport factor 2 family protein [Sphingomonas sp. BT-65]|uniref:nuclear transport factor 2 family protein n=1 Tax=Sphingomonas sp. BT-65 TaxID=2989821 RepID=UPI00223597E0|nr:nuclear transport factor 2 family protein [Sphingomonas sp. BT-65]MCW4460733.1 nuclear transport factor 2 family protein [Sphingomonas sp. BT-65]
MYIRIAMAAVTCLAAAAAAPGAAAGETVVTGPRHGDLLAVADAFDRAQLTQDRAALERMVDDGLVFIQSSGKRAGKQVFIDGWTTPGDSYDPITLVDRVVIRLGPDAFLVSASTTLSGISGGKRFSSSFRFTDTFRRVGGEWRAVHIQVTRTAS